MEGVYVEVLTPDRFVKDILQVVSERLCSPVALAVAPLSSPLTTGGMDDDDSNVGKALAEQLGVAIVDCQDSTNFLKCHIKGATNVTLSPEAASCVAGGRLDLLEWSETLRSQVAKGTKTFVLYNSRSEPDQPIKGPIFANGRHAEQGDTERPDVVAVMTKRLAEKGYGVSTLEGGLEAFQERYREWVWEVAPPEPAITTPPIARGSVNNTPAVGGGNSLGKRRRLRLSLNIPSPAPPPLERFRHDSPLNEIMENLFLGDEQSSMDRYALRMRNITRILNVTSHISNRFEADLDCMQIKVRDGEDSLLGHLGSAVQFIEEGRRRGTGVLVHCHAGISRSATITIAYLMFKMGLTMTMAHKLVQEKRAKIDPKFNYMSELFEYEKELGVTQPSSLPSLPENHEGSPLAATTDEEMGI